MNFQVNSYHSNMKAIKKILGLVLFGGVVYAVSKLVQRDEVEEKLFALFGEDLYLDILDKLRLVGDLLMWPVDFVRALLP